MAILNASIYSSALQRTIPVTVVLPSDKTDMEGKRCAKPPFKTLYLLHGIFGDQQDWLMQTRIARWAMDHNIAVVMPAGENHFYLNQPGRGFNYGDLIGEELVDLTREMFPLSDQKEDTFIGGLSMGGFGALINGMRNPETFGGIIALSSAVVDENSFPPDDDCESILGQKSFVQACSGKRSIDEYIGTEDDLNTWIRENAKNGQHQKIYLACGTDDFLIVKNRDLRDRLEELGYDVTYDEQPGSHDWDFWDMEIYKALNWIDPKVEEGISSGNVGSH